MPKVIVILNKIDMLPEENRDELVKKKVESLKKILSKTKFGQQSGCCTYCSSPWS